MTNDTEKMTKATENPPVRIPPPSKHQLSLMIWAVRLPALTAINVAFGDWLRTMSPVLRTFVLATAAVPVVIYGLMPYLHRLRVHLLMSAACGRVRDAAPTTFGTRTRSCVNTRIGGIRQPRHDSEAAARTAR